jgi:hypothetical protein
MIYLLAVGGFLCLMAWIGRHPNAGFGRHRLARAFLSAFTAVAAVVAGLRGAWIASAILIGASVLIGGASRARLSPGDPSSMTAAQARSILGIGPSADRTEIERAYRRLMRRVHPDAGGATGLAAQLNAARDVLLR